MTYQRAKEAAMTKAANEARDDKEQALAEAVLRRKDPMRWRWDRPR